MQRKLAITICGMFVLFHLSLHAGNPWKSVGPDGADFMFSVTDSLNSANIVAVTQSPYYVYRTSDGGQNWARLHDFGDVSLSAMTAPSAQRIYGIGLFSFYSSANGGQTWQTKTGPGTYFLPTAMCSDPLNPDLVFAAGIEMDIDNSLERFVCYKSTNAGTSWTGTPKFPAKYLSVYGLALSASSNQVLYACGYSYDGTAYKPTLYKSTDGGTSWADISSKVPAGSSTSFNSVAIDPKNNSRVYVAGASLYRSTDGGNSWSTASTMPLALHLAISPSTTANLFASASDGVYSSTNYGANWSKTASIFGSPQDLRLTSNILYLSTDCGLFKSPNSTQWTDINCGIRSADITLIRSARSSPGRIWTLTSDVGLYSSADRGNGWQFVPYPLDCGTITDLSIHLTNPNSVIILGPGG